MNKQCQGPNTERLNEVADLIIEKLQILGFNAAVIVGSERAFHLKIMLSKTENLGSLLLYTNAAGTFWLETYEIRTAATRKRVTGTIDPYLCDLLKNISSTGDTGNSANLAQTMPENG